MRKQTSEQFKGGRNIYKHGNYIVMTGQKLWILNKDTSLIACRQDIKNASKIAFLSGNRLLIGQEKKAAYRMISLENGDDIWVTPSINMDVFARRFAISPEEVFAFDYFYWRGKDYFVSVDLGTGEISKTPLQPGLSATMDIVCDEDGVPCLLQTQQERISDKLVYQNGIRYHNLSGISPGSSYYWKYKWQSNFPTHAVQMFGCGHWVLTSDLCILDLRTGQTYSLLAKEQNWIPPNRTPYYCIVERDQHLLILVYDDANVVVDWQRQEVVARYNGKYAFGCLIGDEYWISAETEIRRVPYPVMEPVLPEKMVFWGDFV